MSSQFFGLEVGYSGLMAYNAALNTTANNIANIDTKGYSRQKTNQTAAQALRTYTSYGMMGTGVVVNGIDQIRDAYYDVKYREATTNKGEYDTKAYYMKQIENYFNDDGDKIIGFNTIYDTFYTALENMENNPYEDATRVSFLGSARQLMEYFNSMYENLQDVQADANNSVKDTINQINALAAQIASINKQINTIEIQGTVANELRDQRNNLVDELSQYVDLKVVEDEMCANNDPELPLGIYRYQVYISGGQTLVDGYECRSLECTSRMPEDKVNQSDIVGLYDITWSDTGIKYYPVGGTFSGSLTALLNVRDGNNKEYFRGRISDFTGETGTANARVSVTIDKSDADPGIVSAYEYLSDMTKCTLNETGTISLMNKDYSFDSWSYTENADGSVTYEFVLSDDAKQEYSLSDIASGVGDIAKVGKSVDYQGIPYYMSQMNEWIRTFATAFNGIMNKGSDANGDPMTLALFTANLTDGTQTNFDNPTKSKEENYWLLTAGNAAVNDKLLKNVSLLATTYENGNIDVENSDLVHDLSAIKYDKNVMIFRGCSSSEFLSCVLGDVALNANSANTFSSNYASAGRIWVFTDGEETNGEFVTALTECIKSGIPVTIVGFGTGKEVTIKQLAETVKATVGYEGEIVWNSDMPDGTPRKLTNVDKLHSIGWTHKVELEEGVKLAYDWFRENVDTARM